MLHKPVVLKLEEPRVTGKLSQHCRHVLTSTIGGLKYMCASDWFALGFTGLPFSPIKVMTPVEGPIFHMGGMGRKGNTAKH